MKGTIFAVIMTAAGIGSGYAQSVYRRSVVDEQSRPLDYFNVVVRNPADSTFLQGHTFMNGKLEMEHSLSGRKLVEIQCLGYEDLSYVENFSSPTAPATLVMKAEIFETDAVEVTGRIPVISTSQGKTVVRVAGSPLENLAEVDDILRRAPRLKVEEDGITVFGKGTPKIYIDGREATYEELQMLRPSQITSIEIDSNPSARYDAAYASVVSVKTNRSQGETSGQIANHSYFRRRYGNRTEAQLQISGKKWVNFFSYNHLYGEWRSNQLTTEAIHLSGHEMTDSIYTDATYSSRAHSLLYGSTLDINPRHQFSWQYSGLFNDSDNRDLNEERIVKSGLLSEMLSDKHAAGRRRSHSANVRYRFAADSLHSLEITADWARAVPRSNQTVRQHYVGAGSDDMITIANRSPSDIFSAKAEYTAPLFGAELLVGLRYGNIYSRTTTMYGNTSGITTLKSDNVAAYATLGREYSKWGWEGGLRGEFLNDNVRVDGAVLRRGWKNNLFPSAMLYTRGLLRMADFSLSYTSRIIRPTVGQLNPSASYVNSLVTSYGNPLLLSTICHNFELMATLWGDLSLTLGADFDINPNIDSGELSQDGNSIAFRPVNVKRSREYLVSATYNHTWGPVSVTLDSDLAFPRAKIPYLGETIIIGKPSWQGGIDVDLKLGKNTSLTAGFEYQGRNYYLMTVYEPAHSLSAGVTQYLFERRVQLSLSGYDLLRGINSNWHDRYGFYETTQRGKYDTRYVRLSLKWLFNDHKARYNERGSSEEFRRID